MRTRTHIQYQQHEPRKDAQPHLRRSWHHHMTWPDWLCHERNDKVTKQGSASGSWRAVMDRMLCNSEMPMICVDGKILSLNVRWSCVLSHGSRWHQMRQKVAWMKQYWSGTWRFHGCIKAFCMIKAGDESNNNNYHFTRSTMNCKRIRHGRHLKCESNSPSSTWNLDIFSVANHRAQL